MERGNIWEYEVSSVKSFWVFKSKVEYKWVKGHSLEHVHYTHKCCQCPRVCSAVSCSSNYTGQRKHKLQYVAISISLSKFESVKASHPWKRRVSRCQAANWYSTTFGRFLLRTACKFISMNAGSETRPVSHPTWSKGKQKNRHTQHAQTGHSEESFGVSVVASPCESVNQRLPLGTRHAGPGT